MSTYENTRGDWLKDAHRMLNHCADPINDEDRDKGLIVGLDCANALLAACELLDAISHETGKSMQELFDAMPRGGADQFRDEGAASVRRRVQCILKNQEPSDDH